MSHLGDAGLYMASKEKLSILIKVTNDTVKNQIKPSIFHSRLVYTTVNIFLRQVKAGLAINV